MTSWLLDNVLSVQYKTTVDDESTIAFKPTGGSIGLKGSGAEKEEKKTKYYFLWVAYMEGKNTCINVRITWILINFLTFAALMYLLLITLLYNNHTIVVLK